MSPVFVPMEVCGLILTANSQWNKNPSVHFTLLCLRLNLMSLVEAQCWMQLLLGTMNCLGRCRMLLKHFRRLCFSLVTNVVLARNNRIIQILTLIPLLGFYSYIVKGMMLINSVCS
ncbi:unnamed protein product [Brassica rapa subsp. trilocularis]